eukprot:jgi/Bigna1/77538/fgenesh1_pg.48_\
MAEKDVENSRGDPRRPQRSGGSFVYSEEEDDNSQAAAPSSAISIMGNVDSAAVRTTRREKRQQAREEVMEDDDDDCSSIDECQPLISRTRSSRRENEGEYTDEKYQEEAASPTNTAPAKQHLERTTWNEDAIMECSHKKNEEEGSRMNESTLNGGAADGLRKQGGEAGKRIEEGKGEMRTFFVAIAILGYIAVSSGMIVFNKYLLFTRGFHRPLLLTVAHMLFATITTQVVWGITSAFRAMFLTTFRELEG